MRFIRISTVIIISSHQEHYPNLPRSAVGKPVPSLCEGFLLPPTPLPLSLHCSSISLWIPLPNVLINVLINWKYVHSDILNSCDLVAIRKRKISSGLSAVWNWMSLRWKWFFLSQHGQPNTATKECDKCVEISFVLWLQLPSDEAVSEVSGFKNWWTAM